MKRFLFILTCLLCLNISAKRVGVYCYFAGDNGLKYNDSNISLYISGSELIIDNHSGRNIYIDYANSFVFINGKITCLADESAYLSILNAVDENVISRTNIIHPGSYKIYSFGLQPSLRNDVITPGDESLGFGELDFGHKGFFVDSQTGVKTKFKKGMSRHYDVNTTPLDLRAIIRISPNQDLSDSRDIPVQNYITDIVIDSWKGVYDKSAALPYCIPYKGRECEKFMSGGANFGAFLGNVVCGGLILGSAALLVIVL